MRARIALLLAILPSVVWAASDPNQSRGFTANNVYQVGEIDHVNLLSGNAILRIPIGQVYNAGPTLEYQFVLSYNSVAWTYKFEDWSFPDCESSSIGCSLRYGIPETTSNTGFGWTLSLGRLIPGTTVPPAHGWKYLAADGSEHEFKHILAPAPTLPPADPNWLDPTQARTTDGSYLQMRKISASLREVEFGDGHIESFDANGNLTEMRDRHGNWVRITYSSTQWTITDGYGNDTARTHYVNLLDRSASYTEPNFQKLISSVQLEVFDNTPSTDANDRATYTFSYDERRVGRGGGGERHQNHPTRCVAVPLLDSVTFPDGTSYDPSYKAIADTPANCDWQPGDDFSVHDADEGVIQSLKLPTRGSIQWTHGVYPLNLQQCLNGTGFASEYVGVTERKYLDAGGAELMKWTYSPTLLPMGTTTQTCEGQRGVIPAPAEEFMNDVEITSGGRKLRTRHYFSVFPAGGLTDPTGVTARGFTSREYGLPFTHNNALSVTNPSGGANVARLLSSEVADCTSTCDTYRKSYVEYDQDVDTATSEYWNQRPGSERTVHVKDTSCGGANCYTDVQRESWDSFGHYEKSTTTSNIPGSLDRVAFTNHTPDQANWLLEPYAESWVKEGTGATATGTKAIAEFDATLGVMKSLRKLRATGSDPASFATSTTDLLTVWCRDTATTAGSRGFVTSERSFGGNSDVPTGDDACPASRSSGRYFIDHTYAFSGAKITGHKTKYNGATATITDDDLDWRTGLPWKSRDASGLATEYRFDSLGRLKSLQPSGLAWGSYDYSPATTSTKPAVTERQCANSVSDCTSATSLTEAQHYYDDLGRLVEQRRRLTPSTLWSATWLTYDALGRKESASVAIGTPTGDSGTMPSGTKTTTWDYDILGRVSKVTAPDDTYTDIQYSGFQDVRRGAEVGLATPARVYTREKYDSVGRLLTVIENDGAPDAETTS